jgi:trans-aconitate methyltransferase
MHAFIADCVSSDYKTALDVGCGTGLDAPLIMYKNPNCYYTGVDVNDVAIAIARENFRNCRFIEGDFLEMNIQPQRYDLVICNSVLEHKSSYEQMAKKLASCARRELVLGFYRGLSANSEHEIQKVDADWHNYELWHPKYGRSATRYKCSYLNTYSEAKVTAWLEANFPAWDITITHLFNPVLKEFPRATMVRMTRRVWNETWVRWDGQRETIACGAK